MGNTYEEELVKERVLNDEYSIAYVLVEIKELRELGWVIREPTIIPNNDGKTVTIKVKLIKYDKDMSMGRSR